MSDQEIKGAIEAVGKAFHEFKETNDQNIKQRDALLDEKLDKINKDLDRFEDYNQKITLATAQAKATQEQLEQLEVAINSNSLAGIGAKTSDDAEYRNAFDRMMRKAPDSRDPNDIVLVQKRMAALVKADDAGAGYLLAPADMQAEIIKGIVLMSPMRSLATVRSIGSGSLKQPKRTGTGAASRIGETTARTNTGDPSYGMVEIQAPEMFSRVEVSLQMVEDSAYDLMAELREDSSEQFAKKEGAEFISGLGAANQAEGILTNADIAEVVSGNATAIKADGLIDLWTALPTAHARNGVFAFNRSTLGAIRKLKDGNGQYLWVPGIAGNVPNTVINSPYVEMPDMPNIGAGLYPVAYGDFRKGYIVVDRIAISFQVDYITGADNGLIVFRGRKRVGGGVRLAEAIKKLKISA